MTEQETAHGAPHRKERDSMGEVEVPRDALFGAQTRRALDNFPISDLRKPRRFVQAVGAIKLEAANANHELGLLDEEVKNGIVQAAEEVVDGTLDKHFVLDVFQTGSGTSTNMNANEVISNRAIQIAGGELGSKTPVHPNDHVNMGQSSNDVIPTAIHLSALISIKEDLLPSLEKLQKALEDKAEEFDGVVKTGRTHLQDATPIRLGQEFKGYAGQIQRGIQRVKKTQEDLSEVALGGTAVAGVRDGYFGALLEYIGQGNAVGYGQLGAEVRNHAHDVVLVGAEVEATVAAFGVAGGFALPLREEAVQRNVAAGEYAQVTVQGQDVLVFFQGQRATH